MTAHHTASSDDLDGRAHPGARRVSIRPPLHSFRSERTDAIAAEALAQIALGLSRTTGLWRPHVKHDILSRTAVRLLATETYEAWLLGWTTGQRVELHDHGGATAAFVVLEGELDELTLEDGGIVSRRFSSGDVRTVPPLSIHDVLNPLDRPATSLHMYSLPLRTMTFYSDDGTPQFTEIVEDVAPVAGEAARALRPSGTGTRTGTGNGEW